MKKTVIVCASIVALVLVFTTFIAKPVTVSGDSMENTYMNGDIVIVNRLSYAKESPKRGDIVVCKPFPRTLYIKRIIAVGGDEVSINLGKTYINGKPIEEPYLKEPMLGEMEPMVIPTGEVFVMGDNRNSSMDSRESSIGTINEKDILGKVKRIRADL